MYTGLNIGCGDKTDPFVGNRVSIGKYVTRHTCFPETDLEEVIWHTLDIDPNMGPSYAADCRDLKEIIGDSEYDLIVADNILEHLAFVEVVPTLHEWLRVLCTPGVLVVLVPDLEWAMLQWLFVDRKFAFSGDTILDYQQEGPTDPYRDIHGQKHMDFVFGAQQDKFDFHKSGFTKGFLDSVVKYVVSRVPHARENRVTKLPLEGTLMAVLEKVRG